MKPWESYKINHDLSLGIIGALTEEDISRVSSIHMAEEFEEGDISEPHHPKQAVRFLDQVKGASIEEEKIDA
jgi:hypothetical protein